MLARVWGSGLVCARAAAARVSELEVDIAVGFAPGRKRPGLGQPATTRRWETSQTPGRQGSKLNLHGWQAQPARLASAKRSSGDTTA